MLPVSVAMLTGRALNTGVTFDALGSLGSGRALRAGRSDRSCRTGDVPGVVPGVTVPDVQMAGVRGHVAGTGVAGAQVGRQVGGGGHGAHDVDAGTGRAYGTLGAGRSLNTLRPLGTYRTGGAG